jgi:hypothetical protein
MQIKSSLAHLRPLAIAVVSLFIGAPVAGRLMGGIAPLGFHYGAAVVFAFIALVMGFAAVQLGIYGLNTFVKKR